MNAPPVLALPSHGVHRYERRGYDLEVETRDDGLRMVRVSAPHLHSTVVTAYYRSGSRYEDPRRAGISHFLEHIVFKGSERYPEAVDLARAAESLGGSLEAETHFEYTTFWIHPHPDTAAEAVDLVRAATTAPLFRKEDIALERKVILQECRDYRDDLEGDRELASLLWPTSKTTLHPLGGARSIRGIGRRHLADWHARTYQPATTVLVVAGAFDNAAVADAMRAWPRATDPPRAPEGCLGPVAEGGELFFRGGEKDRLDLRIYYPAPSYSDPRDVALWVLGEILGGAPTSRFFLDLREERGLAYEAVTSYLLFRGAGFLECRASVHPSDGPEALSRMLAAAADLAERGPSPEELDRFRTVVATRMEANLDRPEELASWFGLRALLVPERLEFLDEESDRIAALTPGEIRELAAEVLCPDRAVAVAYGDVPRKIERGLERVWCA